MLNQEYINIHKKDEQAHTSEPKQTAPLIEFHALLVNGCEQIQVSQKAHNKHLFHLYLQAHYPFHICLYVNQQVL